jgi:hypothetical protein
MVLVQQAALVLEARAGQAVPVLMVAPMGLMLPVILEVTVETIHLLQAAVRVELLLTRALRAPQAAVVAVVV